MDINLPLLLFIAVAFTGVFSLIDLIFLRRERLTAIAEVEKKFASLDDESKQGDEKYLTAINDASAEAAVFEYSKSFFPVLMLVFVLRSFLVEPFQIPSESMVPTLEVGDFIVVSKFSYGLRLPLIRKKVVDISDPKRGDVMVFFPPNDDRYFIKRVIGLPGDSIRYSNHELYINGEKIRWEVRNVESPRSVDSCVTRGGNYVVVDEFIDDRVTVARRCTKPGRLSVEYSVTVPEGYYFMMGDNRDNSSDSRDWGLVPQENIVGKAVAKWMHWDKFLSLPSFSRVGKIH